MVKINLGGFELFVLLLFAILAIALVTFIVLFANKVMKALDEFSRQRNESETPSPRR